MSFEQMMKVVSRVLENVGEKIDETAYDGVIVKKLEASNTLDKNRTTKQSHIAITGEQMDIFPYVRADGYFNVDYDKEDSGLKKFFVAQIPAYIHKHNIEYLDSEADIIDGESKKVYISIVRSRRKDAPDQIQMSMSYMDSPEYIKFRKIVHAGSYMILLKKRKELEYDLFAVKEQDIEVDGESLKDINNQFGKDNTNTVLHIDELNGNNEKTMTSELTPEWFNEKGQEFLYLDEDAEEFLKKFYDKFSPKKLEVLEGEELLNTIFINKNNKTNLCYTLEFDRDCKMIFGGIGSGTAYKYGLHYSKKNDSWATGSPKKPQFLNTEEAINVGTEIRDNLLAGVEVIKQYGDLKSLDDYQKMYEDLYDVTDGYINRVWFLKYYMMIFPDIFVTTYSDNAQKTVLEKLGLPIGDNCIYRMGQIKEFVDKCDISTVVFGRTFWTYCNGASDEEIIDEEEIVDMKSCLEIERTPRTNKIHPLNFIIYGAPGTGKTYSTAEYALAILENREVDLSKKTDEERREVVKKYKDYVKNNRIVFTTFHQNYGYEEFIQGLRPDKDSDNMSFKIVDGVFKNIADIALKDTDPNNNYVIVIDEINRANISKVFGELITLIEDDKRWGEINETSAVLQSGDIFAVPNNLYIVGTMNSADKSISLIDAALRRRFDFVEQTPDSSLVEDATLRKVLEVINAKLVKDLDSTDLLVGHSYFMNKTKDDLCQILNNNIIPLVYEYYYDDRKRVIGLIKDLIEKTDINIEIDDDLVGRLKVKETE